MKGLSVKPEMEVINQGRREDSEEGKEGEREGISSTHPS